MKEILDNLPIISGITIPLLTTYALLVTVKLIQAKSELKKCIKDRLMLTNKVEISTVTEELTKFIDFYLSNDFGYNVFVKTYISNHRMTESDFDEEIVKAVRNVYNNIPDRINYQLNKILNLDKEKVLVLVTKIVRNKLINIHGETKNILNVWS